MLLDIPRAGRTGDKQLWESPTEKARPVALRVSGTVKARGKEEGEGGRARATVKEELRGTTPFERSGRKQSKKGHEGRRDMRRMHFYGNRGKDYLERGIVKNVTQTQEGWGLKEGH